MSLRGRALGLIALVAVLAIAAIWSGDQLLGDLWRGTGGVLLAGLAVEGVLARRQHFEFGIDVPRAHLGRPLAARVTLANPSRRAVELEFSFATPTGVATASDTTAPRILVAPAGGRAHLDVGLHAVRLGRHPWPVLPARHGGVWRLAWWSVRLAPSLTVEVVPDLLGTTAPRMPNQHGGAAPSRARGAGAELLQLRPYRPGDPLHRIDWKATARRAGLVTREFVADQHLDVIIVLDAGRASRLAAGPLDRLGVYANTAARLAECATAQDDRVGLVVFADRVLNSLPPTRGHNGVSRLRAALESIEARVAESNPLQTALHVRTLAKQRCLIVLLVDLNDLTTDGELTRAVRLLQIKHSVIVAGVTAPEIDAIARQPAHNWLDPYHALAAQQWRSNMRAQVGALRSAGTAVVAARPADLEGQILMCYARLRRERRI